MFSCSTGHASSWLVLVFCAALGGCSTPAEDNGGMMGTPFPTPGTAGTTPGAAGTPGMVGLPAGAGAAGTTPGAAGTVALPTAGTVALPMAGTTAMMAGSDAMLAGTGGMAGSDMPAGTGGTGEPMMREDLGEGDGNDVVTIGDSYMEFGGIGTEYSLERISGRDYRNYAVAGTRILDGAIPGQFDRAKAAGADIKTVIMTGGGNDIILDFFGNLLACQGAATEAALSAACIAALDEITVGVDALMAEMEASGVQDVFYIGYGHITANELSGTIERTKRVQGEKCRDDDPTKTMRCHFVDPSDALGTMFGADGIHPTVAGYDVIGTMTWERMQMEGARR